MKLPKIACAIKKGGQGKTTVNRILAEFFGIVQRLRVGVLDFDAQMNLSGSYIPVENSRDIATRPPIHPDHDESDPDPALVAGRSSTAEIFFGGRIKFYSVTKVEGMDTVQILPGDEEKLGMVARAERSKFKGALENRLAEFFEAAADDLESEFDVLLMDLPYAENILTAVALRGATHLIIPFDCEPLGLDGVHKMLGMWRKENTRRSMSNRLEILAIQPNRYKSRRASQQELLATLRDEKKSGLIAKFMSNVTINDLNEFSQIYQPEARPQSVFQLKASSPARQTAEQFGEYIEQRLWGGIRTGQPTPAPVVTTEHPLVTEAAAALTHGC